MIHQVATGVSEENATAHWSIHAAVQTAWCRSHGDILRSPAESLPPTGAPSAGRLFSVKGTAASRWSRFQTSFGLAPGP